LISSTDSEDEGFSKRYSKELDTPERRNTFAQKLKDALKSESGYTDSTDDSYACGINVVGSHTDDQEIK
jgi:poly(ADP-ribose) glycohydrolase